MTIDYIISDTNAAFVRPQGYKFPTGLSYGVIPNIANAAISTVGGTQTIDGANAVHTFTTSDFFIPSFGGSVDALILGGGGGMRGGPGGPAQAAPGAGAGGAIYFSGLEVKNGHGLYCLIGGGGASQATGGNTQFANTYTAYGGGAPFAPGGCGGGPGISIQTPFGGSGYGNPGGTHQPNIPTNLNAYGGGGGGIGGSGRPGPSPGTGGIGLYFTISGANVGYGAGSGGLQFTSANPPGSNITQYSPGGAAYGIGVANRGSGGSGNSPLGNPGQSGVIIVRYELSQNTNNGYFVE